VNEEMKRRGVTMEEDGRTVRRMSSMNLRRWKTFRKKMVWPSGGHA